MAHSLASSETQLIDLLLNESSPIPHAYKKVYTTYQYHANRIEDDGHTQALMREKIASAMEAKQIASYRVCKDIGLNNGNLHAFLKHYDTSKLGLDTTRRVLACFSASY